MSEQRLALLTQTIREHYPAADVRPGTTTRDWLLVPTSILFDVPYQVLEALRQSQSIENYATLTDEQMTALAANFFVYRDEGVRPQARVRLGFADAQQVALEDGALFQTSDGTKQYRTKRAWRFSAEQLSGARDADGFYYTGLIDVEAVEPGEDQEVLADELVTMPYPLVGLERVHNPAASAFGVTGETNEDLYNRIPLALSSRQVLNDPGTRYVLARHFRQVSEVLVVGATHELMERDETFDYTTVLGRVLPVVTLYNKTRADTGNRSRALRLATPARVPTLAAFTDEVSQAEYRAMGSEISQAEYRAMGSPNDAEVATLDTGLLFEDTFATRDAFVPAETRLAQDAGGTTVVVENPAFFQPGDLVRITDDFDMFLERAATGDQDVPSDATAPRFLHSDGTTSFLLDTSDRELIAITRATGMRDASQEFGLNSNNADPRGLWGDATYLYVLDGDRNLYVYPACRRHARGRQGMGPQHQQHRPPGVLVGRYPPVGGGRHGRQGVCLCAQ